MKQKKAKWVILLIVGIMLFIVPVVIGIYNSINGYSGLCWWSCEYYYGFDALIDSILIYSYILANLYYWSPFDTFFYNKIKKEKNG